MVGMGARLQRYGVTFSHSSPATGGLVVTAGWWASCPSPEGAEFRGYQDAALYGRAVGAAQPGVGYAVVVDQGDGVWREADGRGLASRELGVLRGRRGWV